jgi:hypothetical protein
LPPEFAFINAISFAELLSEKFKRGVYPWQLSTEIPLMWLYPLMTYYRIKNEVEADKARLEALRRTT